MERITNTSWFIEDNKAIKLCDPTVFKDARTVVPIDRIKDFFCDKELEQGEEVPCNIIFMDENCECRIKRFKSKDQSNPSTFLYWRGTKIADYLRNLEGVNLYNFKGAEKNIEINNYTRMEFTKGENDTIKLEVINGALSNKYIFKKDVDKSTLIYGVTIPKLKVEKFLANITNKEVERGKSEEINLIINDNKFSCRLTNPDRKGTTHEVIQIRYDSNKELKNHILEVLGYNEEDLNDKKIESKGSLEFYSTEEINTFYVKINTDNFSISNMEQILNINSYIQSKGFIYTVEQLSNLYLSLKTKPFVILAGISGTGKSKIVRLFAEALGATTENKQINMISVKPDWNDATELIGYRNLKDQFIEGQLTKIIKEAIKLENKNKPYFICLDEMNLARVEYYLSDYLSIIESRNKVGQEIVTDNIINEQELTLHIPDNIYIIGTVNMDDTTFQFSRKVLDRANTIEFSDVDLENLFTDTTEEEIEPTLVNNNFLKTTYLKTTDIEEEHRAYAKTINKKIIQINEILKKSQKQFAYRVRDEILFYMIENQKAELLHEDIAFDYQIMQKILPAINGSENSIKEILVDLFNYVCDKKVINDTDDINLEEAQNYLQNAKYKNSAQKIIYMLKGYQNDGYISFWC
ncbi:McrB family protein [Romboutsia sp.]|uniref:McrB family protein n=1 Tax=Romboutsia sp. TaxID=1965302 RepID=UPI003F2EB1D8